jgi:hypothetical protein
MGNIFLKEKAELAILRIVTTCEPVDNTPSKVLVYGQRTQINY